MQTLIHLSRRAGLCLASLLVTAGIWLLGGLTQPALAADYITPDGEDISGIVECLPEQLTEGDLQRAIAESGKDYLERVFRTKESYSDYDIAAAEKEFQACLKSKGITPVVEESYS